MTRKLGVVLLSGGLDSTTVATQAVREGYELIAVTVHYGQRHSRELDAAASVAGALGLRHEVVDVSFFRRLAWYSALTNPERFEVPGDRAAEEMAADIPIRMKRIFSASRASSNRATGRGFRRVPIVLQAWRPVPTHKLTSPHRSSRARILAGQASGQPVAARVGALCVVSSAAV